MRSAKPLSWFLSLVVVAAAAGCAGNVDGGGDGVVVDETDTASAAIAVDPSQSDDTGDTEDKADPACTDKDAADHHRHRKHKFKMLDRLDGTKDGTIVIASLPAGLPEKLLAKLRKLDADGDGAVTKAEAKAWLKKKRHHGEKHGGDGHDDADEPQAPHAGE